MFMNPHLSREIADEHQRDMMARADQQRLVRHVRAESAAAHYRQQPQRRLRRVLRVAGLLRPAS